MDKVKDDDIYMVHCTNFFPKNHKILSTYDGNRIYSKEITNGETVKNCITRSHRHTVHFSLNSVVANTGDGRGSWDDVNMIVVEPYKYHKNEFLSAGIGVDSFTYGSVNLSDEAIIFINKDDIKLIPEDEIEKWNIVACDRSIKGAVKNFLGEKLEDYIASNAGHSKSIEYTLECVLSYRDLAINYIKDNIFNSISPLNLTKSEFFQIIDLYKIRSNEFNFFDNLNVIDEYLEEESERKKYDDKIFKMIALSGFYLDEDGFVKIKNEEEIYNIAKSWKEVETPVKYKYDNELIRNGKVLYKEYDEYLKNKEIDKALSNCKCDFNQLDEKTKDIIKSYRPKFFSNGGYFIEIVYREENIIKFFVYACDEEKDKILKRKLIGVENIKDMGDNEFSDFLYAIEGQKDDESYKAFYSRVQEVKDAFIDILFSKDNIKGKYLFGKNGVINKDKSIKLLKDIKNATKDTRWGLIREKNSEINKEIGGLNRIDSIELEGMENDKY